MMNGMSLHPYPKRAPVGRQISIVEASFLDRSVQSVFQALGGNFCWGEFGVVAKGHDVLLGDETSLTVLELQSESNQLN
jgi:hypothetical protein